MIEDDFEQLIVQFQSKMLRLTNDIVPNRSILSILGQLGSRLAAFSRRRFVRVVCRFFGLG